VELALKRKENAAATTLIQRAPGANLVPDLQTNCSFAIKAPAGKLCLHATATLAYVQANFSALGVEEYVTLLEELLLGGNEIAAGEAITTAVQILLDSYQAGRSVLVVGPKGTGKTYGAGELAKHLRTTQSKPVHYIEVPCAPDTEKWNLFRHTVPVGGEYFQVDGPISEAALRASRGELVVLVLDEFLNLNPVYQTMLNSMLSRREGDTYHVYTGGLVHNEDGTTSYETIVVPIANLFVIATGNLGDKYGVDSINPSVRRRFRVKWLHASVDSTMEIVRITLRKNGMPEELANPIQDFMDRIQKSCGQKLLEEDLCTGVMCEVIRAAKATADGRRKTPKTAKAWVPFLKEQLIEEAYQLVSLEEGAENNLEGQLKTFVSIVEESKWKI
jgi:MoxR-like ATPase